MFYLPFWLFMAGSLIAAAGALWVRRLHFIDLQFMIMVAAVAMSCDMLFCKQYHLYYYVSEAFVGWYSFWANLIIVPALAVVFIKFAPDRPLMLTLYIMCWAALATLFEIAVTRPLEIVHYPIWRIFPWSTLGYLIGCPLVYLYYQSLLRHSGDKC